MIDKFDGEYSFLSNFYYSPITPFKDNIEYPTVEHAFQACKTTDISIRKTIAHQPTPGKAKRIGRHVVLRDDWKDIKDQVMYDALKAKFRNPVLRRKLIATGEEELIEGNWWGDTYWGVCNGIGENHLGKLLMRIREEIKSQIS